MAYKNSPLQEVIFEVLIDSSKPIKTQDLRHFITGYEDIFEDIKPRYRFEGNLKVKKDKAVSKTKNFHDGFNCWTKDRKQALVIRPNGFNLIILKPYTGWENSFPLFQKYWSDFSKHFNVKSVKRLAVRNVNNIEIKNHNNNIYEFLKIDDGLNKNNLGLQLRSFLNQKSFKVKHDDDFDLYTTIIETSQYNKHNLSLTKFVLDIDIYCDQTFNLEHFNLDLVFETIRIVKNNVFESYLTDLARESFQYADIEH